MVPGIKVVGDAEWLQTEHRQCSELTQEYIEEFSYLAQNDLRWLNAHMDELLNSDKLNLAEMLKTPGKLRGKTPRAIRKHDTQRAPLTDLFAPNPLNTMSPAQSTPFYEKVVKIKVAADANVQGQIGESERPTLINRGPNSGKDSGYHGTTEYDLDLQSRPSPQRHTPARSPAGARQEPFSLDQGEDRIKYVAPSGPTPIADERIIHVHEDAEAQPVSKLAPETLANTIASPVRNPSLVRTGSINFASLPPRESVIAHARQSRVLHTVEPSASTAQPFENHASKASSGVSVPHPTTKSPTRTRKISEPQAAGIAAADDDDEDDWIAPPDNNRPSNGSGAAILPGDDGKASSSPGAKEPAETVPLPHNGYAAPASPQREQINLYPNLEQSTSQIRRTPAASPSSRRFADGPLSASKSKLFSVLKSAKSMFAGSTGPSAPVHIASPTKTHHGKGSSEIDLSQMPGGFAQDPPETGKKSAAATATSRHGRALRSSLESDKRSVKSNKDAARVDLKLEKAREKEAHTAAEQKLRSETIARARTPADEVSTAQDVSQPKPTSSMPGTSQGRSHSRLAKPAAKQQPSRPVPVNIRVPSQSQRLGSVPPPSAANSLTQGSQAIPANTRQQAASTRSGATTRAGGVSLLTSTKSTRALQAAAKKKDLEEQAAQQKAEKQREQEARRRLAEEEKRRMEAQKLEQARAVEAKIAAKRQEEAKQRKEAAARKAREAAEAAPLGHDHKRQVAVPMRSDGQGTLRQIGKPSNVPEILGTKTSKRALDTEASRHGMASPSKPAGQEAKRRKTNDVDDDIKMAERPSTMAPPKRPSSIRKESASRYVHAPPPAQHHGQSMFKATVTAQHQAQHAPKPQGMYATGGIMHSSSRIPFADSATEAHPSHEQQASTIQVQKAAGNFKTPARPIPHGSTALKSGHKSSPAYQNGDSIALPEILTDSEDESGSDSEEATGGFRAPSWVASPALRDLLTQQQLVDPESVFGPIAPLQMDDVFKNGKNGERLKKFRDRGSSARWVETGDAVTAEEKRKDREARAKMFRDGGWSFSKDV